MKEQYEPKFVETLFDKMSGSYERMNYVTSFGFSELWRRQCVNEIEIEENKIVVDLLTGMGECWKYIFKHSGGKSKIIGLDFSAEMLKHAEQRKRKIKHKEIELLKEDVFDNSMKDGMADYVISGFGLKTFDDEQLDRLAGEIERILKVGGQFSLLEVSVPENKMLRAFYMFYLKTVIPVLGRLFLGDPETYRMLGIYTEDFGNARKAEEIFGRYNFEVEYCEYFFGCASGIRGIRK